MDKTMKSILTYGGLILGVLIFLFCATHLINLAIDLVCVGGVILLVTLGLNKIKSKFSKKDTTK